MGEGRLLAGRYRLDAVVGRGGMGTVWRARDTMLHREVAVKEVLLPPGLAEDERAVMYERTLREARASARLSHPGVVVVHDVVEEDGRPWIVMELLIAPSLQDVLDEEGPLAHARVADIGLQMLGALRHAHSKGIMHRDVKPSNVLLCDSGRVVLTDFGIAQMEGDATLTQTGLVMGSPAYIPPERAQGARAVPASDLWALGATMYAALEGRSPYERSDAMSSLQAALLEPVPPPRNAGPLRQVLDGLLARQPMHRMSGEQAEPLLARVAATAEPSAGPSAGVTMNDEPRTLLDGPGETVTDPGDLPRMALRQEPPSVRRDPQPVRHDPPSVRRDPPSVRRDPPSMERATPHVPLSRTAPDKPSTRPAPDPGETIQREPYSRTPAAPTAPAPTGRNRHTVLLTVIVLLVVGAVLAAAYLVRQQVKGGDAPSGFKTFSRDGYSMAAPADWQWTGTQDGSPKLQSPDTNSFVQMDTTAWTIDAPTPAQQARKQANLAPGSTRLPGYHGVSMTSVTYQGVAATDWEFIFVRDTAKFHVVDRFVRLSNRPFALYFRTPEKDWADSQKVRSTIYDTFKVG